MWHRLWHRLWHYTCDSECDTECDIIHVTPIVTSDMWQNVTLKLTTNVTVYSWLLRVTYPSFSRENLRPKHALIWQFLKLFRFVNCYHSFSRKIFSLLMLSSSKLRLFFSTSNTKYDCSSFAPLEFPKFAWHHHQTLDTYTIFFFRVWLFPFWGMRKIWTTQILKKASWP